LLRRTGNCLAASRLYAARKRSLNIEEFAVADVKQEMDWLELTRIRSDLDSGKEMDRKELREAIQWSISHIHRLEEILDEVEAACSRPRR